MEAIKAPVRDASELESVIAEQARAPNGGLVAMTDSFLTVHRVEIASLAARYRLPAVYPFRYFTEAGGLMSYGSDQIDNIRRAAIYADQILKGAKPGELPVQAPVKFELVINLKTAKALGLDHAAVAARPRRRGDRMKRRCRPREGGDPYAVSFQFEDRRCNGNLRPRAPGVMGPRLRGDDDVEDYFA